MSEPTSLEVRLRLIEAAARAPVVHKDGPAAGVLEVAKTWADWVLGSQKAGTLGLPKK
jgi:hypothetical protein